jgi:hypothetical protein
MKLFQLFAESTLNEISLVGNFADQDSEHMIRELMNSAGNDFVYVDQIGSYELYVERSQWPLKKYLFDRQHVVFYLSDHWGNPVGVILLAHWDNRTYRISNIQLRAHVRRQGIGFGFYRYILDHGFNLVSDHDQTQGSQAIWSKLARFYPVYAVEYHDHIPTYTVVTDTDMAYSGRGRHLIARGRNAKLPQEYEAAIMEHSMLVEAQDYHSMFAGIEKKLINYIEQMSDQALEELNKTYSRGTDDPITREKLIADDVKYMVKQFSDCVVWAKEYLKKNDRIVWFLRLARLSLVYSISRTFEHTEFFQAELDAFIRSGGDPSDASVVSNDVGVARLEMELEHYLSLPIPEIQNTVFDRQSSSEIIRKFRALQQEWISTRKSLIPYQLPEGDRVLMSWPNGYAWIYLNRGSCAQEGDAMGHCGNGPSEKPGDRLLSLRQVKQVGAEKFWVPSLTFILHADGYLGEMKGRGNEKPADKYHPYIVKLLQDCDLVQGIRGGGYMPSNNFSINDLDSTTRIALSDQKPGLADIKYYYNKWGVDTVLTEKILNTLRDYDLYTSFYGFTPDNEWVIVSKNLPADSVLYQIGSRSTRQLMEYFDIADNHPTATPKDIENFFVTAFNRREIAAIGKYLAQHHTRHIYDLEHKRGMPEDSYNLTDPHQVFDLIKYLNDTRMGTDARFYNALYSQVNRAMNAAIFDIVSEYMRDYLHDPKHRSFVGGSGIRSRLVSIDKNIEFSWVTNVQIQIKTEDFISLVNNTLLLSQISGDNEWYLMDKWTHIVIDIPPPSPPIDPYSFDKQLIKRNVITHMPDFSRFLT